MSAELKGLFADKKFLIVDDDPIFSETVAAILEREGGEVARRGDGAAGLDHLANKRCDLAVIDLIMPKVDGIRLISILRRLPRTKDLPIVVITSRQDRGARVEAERLDVELFLTKPVRWTQFRSQICSILDGARDHQVLAPDQRCA